MALLGQLLVKFGVIVFTIYEQVILLVIFYQLLTLLDKMRVGIDTRLEVFYAIVITVKNF